jgi:GTP-binding protein Era
MVNKCAMITICGRPNVGKSTLTNKLAGEKVAIVSSKPQTTRTRITAVAERFDTQFVFLDTRAFTKRARAWANTW